MAIIVLPTQQIAIAGEFTHLQPNGASAVSQCDFLARLNSNGTLDTTFTVNPLAAGSALAVQADGKLLIGGSFTTLFPVNSSGEQSYAYLARINPDGSIDPNYSPTPNQEVDAIALQADGSAVIGGYFTSIQAIDKSVPVPAAFAGRILPNGAVDATMAPDTDGGIFAAVQDSSSGQWYVGGTFTSIDGVTQPFLARLNSDGSLDRTYTPSLNGSVKTVALQSDGKLLVGGNFTAADGVVRADIMRLNKDGSVDGPFNPTANGQVNLIYPLSNGQILITGLFTALYPNGFTTGLAANGFARLNSDGSVDVSFNPNPLGGSVFAIAAQSDGNYIIAGEFTSVGGFGPFRRRPDQQQRRRRHDLQSLPEFGRLCGGHPVGRQDRPRRILHPDRTPDRGGRQHGDQQDDHDAGRDDDHRPRDRHERLGRHPGQPPGAREQGRDPRHDLLPRRQRHRPRHGPAVGRIDRRRGQLHLV